MLQAGYDLVNDLSRIYYNRLKIKIARNGLTFIEDVRDRARWTKNLLSAGETATLEEIPADAVYDKMQELMYMHNLDKFEQRKLVFDLFGITDWNM